MDAIWCMFRLKLDRIQFRSQDISKFIVLFTYIEENRVRNQDAFFELFPPKSVYYFISIHSVHLSMNSFVDKVLHLTSYKTPYTQKTYGSTGNSSRKLKLSLRCKHLLLTSDTPEFVYTLRNR